MIFSHLEENCRICISVIKKDCETFPDSPPHLFKSDDLLDMKFRFARLSQLVFLISFPCGNQQTVIYEIQVLHNILWNCCCFEFFFFFFWKNFAINIVFTKMMAADFTFTRSGSFWTNDGMPFEMAHLWHLHTAYSFFKPPIARRLKVRQIFSQYVRWIVFFWYVIVL